MDKTAPGSKPLDASKIQTTLTTKPKPVAEPNSTEVWAQCNCTDHMVTVKWTLAGGWENPELKPYVPFQMEPVAACLHYAVQCFEGLKAYRGFDGKLRFFRMLENCERLEMSAERISLPGPAPPEVEKLIKELLKVDGPSESIQARYSLGSER
jgi:branched-chain amino acid aminotransferase